MENTPRGTRLADLQTASGRKPHHAQILHAPTAHAAEKYSAAASGTGVRRRTPSHGQRTGTHPNPPSPPQRAKTDQGSATCHARAAREHKHDSTQYRRRQFKFGDTLITTMPPDMLSRCTAKINGVVINRMHTHLHVGGLANYLRWRNPSRKQA